MKLKRRPARTAEIDLSPIIDMTFLLLIFFMVSSSFVKERQLDVKRPTARSGAPSAGGDPPRIAIDRSGALFVDGTPAKLWTLEGRLRAQFRAGRPRTVVVIADRRVPVARLVEVVDHSRLAGAAEVAVATDAELEGGAG